MCHSESLFHDEMQEIHLFMLLLLMGVSSLSCMCDGGRIKLLQEGNAPNIAGHCSIAYLGLTFSYLFQEI